VAKGEGRRTWSRALVLFGVYDLFGSTRLAALIGVGLIGASLLTIAAAQVLWAAAELRRFRRALERGE
jgi:hypothetical protein